MSDPNGVRLASITSVADIDVVIADSAIDTGLKAYGDIVRANGVVLERARTNCRIVHAAAPGDPVKGEGTRTKGGVIVTDDVVNESVKPVGRVVGALRILLECLKASGRVVVTVGVARECEKSSGCIVVADGVTK